MINKILIFLFYLFSLNMYSQMTYDSNLVEIIDLDFDINYQKEFKLIEKTPLNYDLAKDTVNHSIKIKSFFNIESKGFLLGMENYLSNKIFFYAERHNFYNYQDRFLLFAKDNCIIQGVKVYKNHIDSEVFISSFFKDNYVLILEERNDLYDIDKEKLKTEISFIIIKVNKNGFKILNKRDCMIVGKKYFNFSCNKKS